MAALDRFSGATLAFDAGIAPAFGSVYTSALDGTTLYIGGLFSSLNGGGTLINNMAGIDVGTSLATGFDAKVESVKTVFALAVDGPTVFAGGTFTTTNAVSRNRLAAIDFP